MCGEVVDLVRLVPPKDLLKAGFVQQVVLHHLDILPDMSDTVEISPVEVSDSPNHPIAFLQEEPGKVCPVLSGHARDQSSRHRIPWYWMGWLTGCPVKKEWIIPQITPQAGYRFLEKTIPTGRSGFFHNGHGRSLSMGHTVGISPGLVIVLPHDVFA